MTGYDGSSVVTAAVNGLHGDINREGGNVALKPGVSSVFWNVTLDKIKHSLLPFQEDECVSYW